MCIRDSIQGVGISQQMFDHFNSLSSTLKSIQDELCKVMRDIRHNREDISELQQDSLQVHDRLDILEHTFERFDTTLRDTNVVLFGVYEPTVWDGYNDTDEIVVLLKSNTGITNWSHADIEHNE
eukprot:TRINITY_DN41069_c1_g1_i1.p1 TRINITY_DN41069_c1_g1~~TRINITY_DN41069_c1_g1_i1.p1  ORF type:complete len:124 (+),score=21.70 TRINITY_DN41069_c1_g1_i1:1-372(+)